MWKNWAVMAAATLLGLAGGGVRGDSLTSNNMMYADVRVTAVKDGEVYYVIRGNEVHKPIAQVQKIILSDEAAFNAAEDAFAAKQWDPATEGYEKTLRTTQKPWLKDWVALRLLESASQAGRFDAAIKAYVAMAEKSAESARAITLKMPKADSAYLTEAIKLVDAAILKTKQNATKDVLLNLLIDLHKTRGDMKSANDALQRRMELAAADPNSPEGAKAAAALKSKAIRLALASKEYDRVIQLVEREGGVLSEAADQADALFCLAEARYAKAGDSKEPDVWKEVALGYVRVVAHGPAHTPPVALALMQVAEIHAVKLGEKKTAIRIYQQVMAEFKGQEVAKEAEKAAGALK
jgi:tetratricopeptide (TPR) repeat protein